MSLPTRGEIFTQIIEHLRKTQELCSTYAHLVRDEDKLHAQGWLAMSELFKKVQRQITQLAMKGRLSQ